jgi:RND superfamily putative drug exporter
MVFVFGSFLLGGQVVIKMFGLGLAGAVLLDALVVRMALVPALILVIGKASWSMPPLLDRILPRFNVEGSVDVRPAVEPSGNSDVQSQSPDPETRATAGAR